MSWEPQVGEKCEWQRDTDEWVVVNVLAVQNTEVCIDDGRLMQVVSRAALRPLAPAPEPPKRNTPEYLNTAYDRLDRAVQDVLKWSPDALRELVGAAMSMRDRARNALDTHATPPAPALEPLDMPSLLAWAQGWLEEHNLVNQVPMIGHLLGDLHDHFTVAPVLEPIRSAFPALDATAQIAKLEAEVERLRAALPTEEEILAMRYLKGYAHLCDTPEVETFRAYLARTEAQA